MIRPQLPSGARVELILPNRVQFPLNIKQHTEYLKIVGEFIAPDRDIPVHLSRLILRIGNIKCRFSEIGVNFVNEDPWTELSNRFADTIRRRAGLFVLELGSRTRNDTSYVARREIFSHAAEYCGFDIIEGPNVDVVGDAHRLSTHVPNQHFDLVFANWVFEHLLMPWLAVLEINKVLKMGGELYVNTNQSIAMHDMPWDFWRFSDTSWHGLFNQFTGFEIIEARLGEPVRLTPLRYHEGFKDHEGGVGFRGSAVWARKVAEPRVEWKVNPGVVLGALARAYPEQII